MLSRSALMAALSLFLLPALASAQEAQPTTETEPAPAPAPAPASEAKGKGDEPWRLAQELPEWLFIAGSFRARYEYLKDQFRTGRARSDDDGGLFLRTLIQLELRFKPVTLGFELQDARGYVKDGDTPVDDTQINPIEPLQAYLKLDIAPYLSEGHQLFVRGGLLTVDMGSRRLLARNRYRNTINSFAGVEARWTAPGGLGLHGLFSFPVQRRPLNGDLEDRERNEPEIDRVQGDVIFWGLMLTTPELLDTGLVGELYVFTLHEDDSPDRATADRQLATPGFRLLRRPRKGALDVELESALQLGTSRSSAAASNTRDLDHVAFYVQAMLGYTLDAPWSPRIAVQYDYASGDEDPTDGENNRFDTLFGARRWEYGPTGIYGAMLRSNLNSPGVRLEVKPLETVASFLAYRAFWLASRRDAWVPAGVRDPAGNSGSFVGHQVELDVRWDALPNLRLESGVTALIRGGFAREAPNAQPGGEPVYFYASATLDW